MKANTGLLLLLGAFSLTLTQNKRSDQTATIGRLVGVFVFLVAAATLLEYSFHVSLGLDTFLSPDSGSAYPGRMAPQTASAFALLGVVTMFIRLRNGTGALVVDLLACLFCALVLLIVTGYTLGVLRFFGLSRGTLVAPQTLTSLILLSVVVLSRRAEHGFLSILLGVGVGSKIARVAAPLSLVIPFVLETARGQILQSRIISPEYSAAVVTVSAALMGFALILTLAWRIEGLEQNIRDLSIRDELTKLYNRRGFLLIAERNLRVARRAKSAFSVLFIDLDNLKQVNDKLGHSVGSALLCEMGDILSATFRDTDTIARIGGDEFLVAGVMSEIGVSAAVQRLEKAAADRNLEASHAYPLTFSFGHVTSNTSLQGSLEDLMNQADAAMYIAKRSKKIGRDG